MGRVTRVSVALMFVMLLGIVGASPVAAGGNKFAAIAIAPRSNTVGWSFNYSTRSAAEARALHECRIRAANPDNCRVIVWVKNGCAAVAVIKRDDGSLRRIAWGIAPTKALAKQRAKNRAGPGSFVRAWSCSG